MCHLAGGTLPVMQEPIDLAFNQRVDRIFHQAGEYLPISVLTRNFFDKDLKMWKDPRTKNVTQGLNHDLLKDLGQQNPYSMVFEGKFETLSSQGEFAYGLCNIPPNKNKFFIDGLCESREKDYFDRVYYVSGVVNGLPRFR